MADVQQGYGAFGFGCGFDWIWWLLIILIFFCFFCGGFGGFGYGYGCQK
ncbi:hypothetical protein [Petroclostridium sp. X23]|jgi:hypothetical protein|nr:hypothetical protein [Petroclostridium sp. X23]WHH60166.1 hypothetical protein QKW49_05375 [Petroclostridium sp. X23]